MVLSYIRSTLKDWCDAMKFPSRCCQAFVIPARSMDELRQEFKNYRNHLLKATSEVDVVQDGKNLSTIQFLVPITLDDISPELFEDLNADTQKAMREGITLWTCKYFDSCSGSCGIYENRPFMCREFPTNDVDNKDEDGVNNLCYSCTSIYCSFHPEFVMQEKSEVEYA